jgi:hypothetical protein
VLLILAVLLKLEIRDEVLELELEPEDTAADDKELDELEAAKVEEETDEVDEEELGGGTPAGENLVTLIGG